MRILIIEDEIIIARFIEQQLVSNFNCTVQLVLKYNEAVSLMPQFMPELLVCDINLRGEKDGIMLVNELQKKFVFEVIFITSYQSKAIIERASLLKPLNYIIKPVDEASIYAAIRLAEPLVHANARLGKPADKTLDQFNFTAVEMSIIQLVLQKRSTKEIAELLSLSPYTIKNHRHRLCRKLNLKDENHSLLKWAIQNQGLIV